MGETLHDEDEQVRSLAVSALQAIGPARGSEVRVLIDMLEDKVNGAVIRRHAATALVHELAVPTLTSVSGDADDTLSVRRAAAWTLGKLGASSKSAIRALGVALTTEARSVRWIAVFSLSKLGSVATEAEPHLRRALEDPDPFIREIAAKALRNMEGATPWLRRVEDE